MIKNILVTGAGGYVGSVLVPKLLLAGYTVKALDWFLYGEHVFDEIKDQSNLVKIKGDVRNQEIIEELMVGVDAVIHLACISNDPSYELNPELSKTINYDAFLPLVDIAKKNSVERFIFASSSSVYGVKEDPNVTEELSLEPLTDYSRYKVLCEEYLLKQQSEEFTVLILRPATVCGYSPRLRLDLTVNILTTHAICNNKILVFGGDQKRPNIHIDDIADLYVESLNYSKEKIAGKIFNCGYENHTVLEIANMVKKVAGKDDTTLEVQDSNDKRSYSISSEKIKKELGFSPRRDISQAIEDLKKAFENGLVKDALSNPNYYNIKTMLAANIK